MNTVQLRRVRRLFTNDTSPRHVQRHNMRQWCISVRYLGPHWLLAKPMPKPGGPAC